MIFHNNCSNSLLMKRRFFCFLLILSSIKVTIPTSPSQCPSAPTHISTSSSISRTSSSFDIISSISGGTTTDHNAATSTASNSILEIYEIETYNESTQNWESKIWITSTGEMTIQATTIILPDEYQFTSSWKIDVSGHRRDELGWEYFSNKQRRRRWLRPYIKIEIIKEEKQQEQHQVSVPKKNIAPSKISSRSSIPKINITEFVSNQYNFKGFGCFLSKSLLHKKSCGVSLSFPITSNFDFLERRPYIPAMRGGARIAYGQTTDLMVACYFNVSLPRVIIRSWYNKYWDTIHGFFNIFKMKSTSSVSSSASSSSSNSDVLSISTSSSSIIQDISEKIGITFNFCYSQKRGYEFLPACWYVFLPTIQYIINSWVSSLLSSPIFILNNLDILKYYASSMGLSTTLYPYQTCSLAFSLSGLYFPTANTINQYKTKLYKRKEQQYEKIKNERIKEIKELISDTEEKVIDTIIEEEDQEEDNINRNDTTKVLISSNM